MMKFIKWAFGDTDYDSRCADVARGYEKGLVDALGIIASLGYGENEHVDEGHAEAFRAVDKHLTEWNSKRAAHK